MYPHPESPRRGAVNQLVPLFCVFFLEDISDMGKHIADAEFARTPSAFFQIYALWGQSSFRAISRADVAFFSGTERVGEGGIRSKFSGSDDSHQPHPWAKLGSDEQLIEAYLAQAGKLCRVLV